MNLIYYKSKIGNFGDDLNELIWDELIPNYAIKKTNVDLVGIGSILDDRLDNSRPKIILGSGIRDFLYTPNPQTIISELSFVRGPVSAKVMSLPFITDSAYAYALTKSYKDLATINKKFKISYIPYFEQVHNFDWDLFSKITNFHVIRPTDPIDQVLLEVSQSEKIITSAMHGAIIADIFRIPWLRLKFAKQGNEKSLISELKWTDWQASIYIDNAYEINCDLNLNVQNNWVSSGMKSLLIKNKCKYLKFNLSKDEIYHKKIYDLKNHIAKLNNYINDNL